jgi:sulfite reductase (NADPH) hemoprotein beta-component
VSRAEAAVARIGATFRAQRRADERFFDWVHRQPDEGFDVLLADLVEVPADALPDVLRDVDGAADFKVAQLGGGECAGVSQVFIGAAFYAAAHERRYREAFAAQAKDADAVACARAQLRLIAQGLNDLVNPAKSFRVRRVIDDLGELAQALAAQVQEIAADLARFAAALDDARPIAERLPTFAAIDAWMTSVARFCVERDPQLDIAAALPLPAPSVPLRFVRTPVAVAAD